MGNGQNNKGEDICCVCCTIEDSSNTAFKIKLYKLFNCLKEIYKLFENHEILKLDKLFLINVDNIPDLIDIFFKLQNNFNLKEINIENKKIGNELDKMEIINKLEDCKKCEKGFIIVDKKFMKIKTEEDNKYNDKNIMVDIDKNNNNYSIILNENETIKFEKFQNFVYKFIINNEQSHSSINQYPTRIYVNN